MKDFFIYVLIFISLMACSTSSQKEIVHVAVAASLQPVLKEITANFEEKYSVKVHLISSSSGKLTNQILNGAPIDVFISADTSYPYSIYQQKKSEAPIIFAYGTLTLWTKTPMQQLQTSSKVAIADPKTAPYGLLAQKHLQEKGVYEQLKPRLVFGENIGQVNHFIMTRVVDAALTATSVFHDAAVVVEGFYKELPDYSLPHAMILIKTDNLLARNFVTFVQDSSSRTIFSKFGYQLPY